MSEPLRRPAPGGSRSDGPDLVRMVVAGRYRIVGRLARGGMARVFRARDERLEREVALKVLSPPYANDPRYVARFLDEARAAASISHPNLVHVYDSGSDGDVHYIAMELLERHRSLRDLLREQGPLDAHRAVRIALDLLAGLRVAHARGLVHCDVKSGNVMVHDGSTKLIDFGISRSRADEYPEGSSIGSLHYMAPEQLLAQPLTPATDLYSVGVVLYESLTGTLPYRGDTPDDVAAAHLRGDVTPPRRLNPQLSQRLEGIVLQALRRDPEHRFASADAMIRALESVVDEADDDTQTVISPPPEPRYPDPRHHATAGRAPGAADAAPRHRPSRRSARMPWGVVALVVTVAAVAGLTAIGLRGTGGVPGTAPSSSRPAVDATPTALPAGKVEVPQFVGLSEQDAIAASRAAGLDWTIHWRVRPDLPAGIYAQQPDAGTVVNVGSKLDLWSNRR